MVPENGLYSGGLNPGPLGHESSALTTRPWILSKHKLIVNDVHQKRSHQIPTILKANSKSALNRSIEKWNNTQC